MLPLSIRHHGAEYDLLHLAERSIRLDWRSQDGREHRFSLRVHYSSHCVREELVSAPPVGAGLLRDHGTRQRVFDVDRYYWSLELPGIVDELAAKPTTPVRLTIERNWCLFRLYMRHPLPNGEKYYCFFRIRYLERPGHESPAHQVHLQIESAYARSTPPLTPHGKERAMFGRLLERLVDAKN